MKVCKFGGSSLADAGQLTKVIDIVLSDPQRRIVVVSAPGKRDKDDTKVTDLLIALAKCPIPVRQDPARMRPSDTLVICCDNSKLREDTGWEPEHSLEDILEDTLENYRER